MGLDFLRQLEYAAFPFRVTDPGVLRDVEELLAASLIEGGIGTAGSDQRKMAIVRGITPMGRAHLALERHSNWSGLMAQPRPGGGAESGSSDA